LTILLKKPLIKFAKINVQLKSIISPILFITGFFSLHAQEINLEGKILDTLQNPLANANVLAIPRVENENIAFSISNAQGDYKLNLKKGKPYTIEISYLGYQKISDSLTLQENTTKNYRLTPSNERLEEIIIKSRLPVTIKEDTITYRTDVFVTGEERKLREVLKKLPGVEVDRAGNVTVNGKKVDRLLVEGKTFFTGDTKLGVNNIPADVVDEVVVLDNYSEIPFLKGLNDSDKMALNIKLKEGKKKFVFGDIEVGGGIEDRYLVHPSLFYYSPKTSVNLIGDLNNTGKKSFTFQDYLNFEGGFSKLIDDPAGYFNLANSSFAQSLQNQDFIFSRHQFGAFNISQQLSNKTTINAYSIVNGSKTDTQVENRNTYLIDNTITNVEDRSTNNSTDNFFSLNKATLTYIPNADEDLRYEAVVKTVTGTNRERLASVSRIDSNFVNTRLRPTSLELLQNIAYSKQFSYKHTTTVNATMNVTTSENATNWLFSDAIFNGIIPIEGESPFAINQQVASKNYTGSLGLKHYWVLSNFHHIYPVAGYSFSRQEYNSLDQEIVNGSSNSFQGAGFNNETVFQLNDSYAGFQYKTKVGDVTFKPGLVYHYYYWDVDQFNTSQTTASKAQLLPEFLLKWDLKSSEKINLKYNLKSQFNDASFYANRLRLLGFNNLYQGNEDLENSLRHQASLTYYKFSLLKGLFYNAGLTYSKNTRAIRSATIIDDIDQINTSIYTSLPESNLSIYGSFSKKIRKVKFTVGGSTSFNDYSRNVNNEVIDYSSNSYSYNFKTETSFKDLPNLEVGFEQRFSTFSSSAFENKFNQTDPYAILQYDFLDGFILNADYRYTHYENKENNTLNTFEIGNTSLYYNKEDSPWGFEVDVNNLFDVNFKNENSFNQFIINDTRIFIQPRTILFKISYKL